MSLRFKVVIANLFSLILPFVVRSIVLYTGAYDNTTIGFIYLAHLLIPFFFFLVLFREDSLMKGISRQVVFWRTVAACFIWSAAVGLEPRYSNFIDLTIIPALAVEIFGNTALPPLVPQLNNEIPAYYPMFFSLVLFYDVILLTLAVCVNHCGKKQDNEGE